MRLRSNTLMTGLWMKECISLDRSENMRLMGRCVTSFHLKALPVCFCKEIQLCGSDGENKTESWWRRKGFHIPSPYLKRLMKCLASHHLYSEIVSQMEPALKHLPEDWAGWYERRLTTHTFSDKTKETKTKPRQTVVSRTEQPAWKTDSTKDQLVKWMKTIPLKKLVCIACQDILKAYVKFFHSEMYWEICLNK